MGVVFMCSNTFGHVVYIQRICAEIGCLLKIVRLPTPHLAHSEVTRELHRRTRPGGPWSPITLTLNCHTVQFPDPESGSVHGSLLDPTQTNQMSLHS